MVRGGGVVGTFQFADALSAMSLCIRRPVLGSRCDVPPNPLQEESVMRTPVLSKNIRSSAARSLIQRHYRQIINRSDELHDELCKVLAITFLPGDRTCSFLNQPLRPLGTAAMICLSFGRSNGRRGRTMPIRGVHARLNADGSVAYRADEAALFLHDAACPPSTKSRSLPLNPSLNPSLTSVAQRMDHACERRLGRRRYLPSVPQLPQILLGFPEHQPPAYENTQALRDLAAAELSVPADQLGANGDALLDRYLRDLWQRQLLWPGDPANPVGGVLIDAEFCTQAHAALRAYENFANLLGTQIWNPARRVSPQLVANPARQVLQRFGITDLDQPITDGQLADLESAMREAIGRSISLTQEEIYDAIANSELPIRAWSVAIPDIRRLLDPMVSQCTSDDDLLCAAASPDEPLVASGMCRVQVIQRHTANDDVALSFPPDDLESPSRSQSACLEVGTGTFPLVPTSTSCRVFHP